MGISYAQVTKDKHLAEYIEKLRPKNKLAECLRYQAQKGFTIVIKWHLYNSVTEYTFYGHWTTLKLILGVRS